MKDAEIEKLLDNIFEEILNDPNRNYLAKANRLWKSAPGYNFVTEAFTVKEDEVNPDARVLYVEFRNGYMGDFQSEDVLDRLDEKLKGIEEVEDVIWEDREFFHIFYKEETTPEEVLEKVDKKITELSKLTE